MEIAFKRPLENDAVAIDQRQIILLPEESDRDTLDQFNLNTVWQSTPDRGLFDPGESLELPATFREGNPEDALASIGGENLQRRRARHVVSAVQLYLFRMEERQLRRGE